MEPIGVYIHVPFCRQKCPYCDFYSMTDMHLTESYTECIVRKIYTKGKELGVVADTLYFGGGTPSALGARRLGRMIDTAKQVFGMRGAEITVEVNPALEMECFFETLAEKGVNRVSIGVQSAHESELQLLGRIHTARQIQAAVTAAQKAGITNISMDLMVGIARQTKESLRNSIAFCRDMGAGHLSAYLLKIEPDTPYARQRDTLILPNDDQMSELYLFMVQELEKQGYFQYEISNFAQKDKHGILQISRHNLKYWQSKPYLGIGPAAHSFINGERFYYSRSLEDFLTGKPPIADGVGGSKEEFAMLALRLTDGLTDAQWEERFGELLPQVYKVRAKQYETAGLVRMTEGGFALTAQGFLVSNALIGAILYG